jgi:hypothetical protein
MDNDLRDWLDAVWAAGLAACGANFLTVYEAYESVVPSSERTFSTVSDEADWVLERRHGSGDFDDEDVLGLGGENTGAGYLYVASPSFQPDGGRWRVVIHVRPYDKLVRLMRLVSSEIVEAGRAFRNVNGAKVMTPECFQSGRNDTLIIYVKDRQTVDFVLVKLRMWIAEGLVVTKDFGGSLPKTICQVFKGVGYACEPPNIQLLDSYRSKPSYGKYLSQIISIAAMIGARAAPRGACSKADFRKLATMVLRLAGIDAAKPHEFGNMDAVFRSSIPWKFGNVSVRLTPLYKAVIKEMDW